MLYKKGKARRELLIDATLSLLNTQHLENISMHKIAKEAKIPSSSAYHFFENTQEVFVALGDRFGIILSNSITKPYSKDETNSWQQVYMVAVDRAIKIYNGTPAYSQLILGPYTPPAIKLTDRDNDEQLGMLFASVLKRYFDIPEIENFNTIVFHSIEIVDLFLSLSYIKDNTLDKIMISEAKIAAIAYLKHYIPENTARLS